MEGTASQVPVIDYLSEAFPDREFMLIDIGCGGGIGPVWRRFGSRLRVLAIDPNVVEIERLKGAETHGGISYLAAQAGLPADHPFARQKGDRGYWGRNPWGRLSTAKSIEMMKSDRRLSASEMVATNLWPENKMSDKVIVIPSYLRDQGITSVDFVKIDVDGADFDILNSFDLTLDTLGVLGVGIEVNYFGSARETDNTFHNVDRFMKGRGFELFGLTTRHYSVDSLPSRYISRVAGQTEFGRPLQGDALYVRDLGSHEYEGLAARLPLTKLLNIICIFSAFNLPDCASEIALRFRDMLNPSCDVGRILDLLAAQAQGPIDKPLSYHEYMRRFDSHDAMFFTQGFPLEVASKGNGRETTARDRTVATESSTFGTLRRVSSSLKRAASQRLKRMMFERLAPKGARLLTRWRPSPVEERMRNDWDDRARKDARYYIVTNAAESEEQFVASGEQSVRDILADIDHLLLWHATVLEIGCGVGRMLRPLAQRFASVYGVDVSPEMISRARDRLSDLENVRVRVIDGSTLKPIKSDTVDLAISYLVFQHIPDASVVETLIQDTFRVLRGGGLFKFQVAGHPDTNEASFTERARPKDTWAGVSFSDSEIRQVVEGAGFTVRSTYSHQPSDSCNFLWVIAEKAAPIEPARTRLSNGLHPAPSFRRC